MSHKSEQEMTKCSLDTGSTVFLLNLISDIVIITLVLNLISPVSVHLPMEKDRQEASCS